MRIIVVFSFLLLWLGVSAQDGFISGQVFDGSTGETLPGVTILVENSGGKGTISDLDGKYRIKLPAGTYTISLSFISYETVKIEGIVVNQGKATVVESTAMQEETIVMEELVVTATSVKNTETAMLTIKKKSPTVLDGISASSLKKIGDSDAASSMKRVTGVSVVGGKYVYVRGLGDRYTKTILNGVEIPGLDPDRNSLQMDIFPSNIIDNIVVYKSFDASLPADFTGGVIDIQLLDFPDDKTASFSLGAAYDPVSHFNSDYLTYEGGSTDFLGFDDGTRAIPAIEDVPFLANVLADEEAGNRFEDILTSFSPTMAATNEMSLMDVNMSATYGNQKKIKNLDFGYNFALSYKNTTEFYEDAVFWNREMNNDYDTQYELDSVNSKNGSYGVNNVLVAGLAGFAIKSQRSKIRLNFVHLQNGESTAGIFDYDNYEDEHNGYEHSLTYSQRTLSNILIDGKHTSQDALWTVIWKLSPTYSTVIDPDIRLTRYQLLEDASGNEYAEISPGETEFPTRTWRYLHEINVNGLVKAVRDFEFNNQKSKLLFGGGNTFKRRDYEIYTYTFKFSGDYDFTGNPDELFYESNLYPNTEGLSLYYDPNFLPNNSNAYNAYTNDVASFVSSELGITKKFKATVGLRSEYYVHYYTGDDVYNEKMLESLDLFPTINTVYSLTENTNLRASYSKTIARPSFKEMSYAEIEDPISGTAFVGGLYSLVVDGDTLWDGNLTSTDIHNFDLRLEGYYKAFMVSISGFYKKFYNPIELVQYTTDVGSFQPRNVGDATVKGVEFETRIELKKLMSFIPNFSLNTNVTLVDSKIEMTESEYESRVKNAREGQKIDEYRNMAGQAPYIVNAGFAYNGAEKGMLKYLEAGLYYNVQGKTLTYVGILNIPDIYALPFNSLNFTSSYKFGKDKRMKASFKVKNILKAHKDIVYDVYGAEDEVYKSLSPLRTFSFSWSYKFF